MNELAYIGGKFVPLSEATVSIDDRGFVFADGVYEVIAVYGGVPFRLAQHWQRLIRSAQAIRLNLPVDLPQLEEIVQQGLIQSGLQEAQIYIQVTRGASPRSHAFPSPVQPTLVITFRPSAPLPQTLREQGVSVITTEDIRWKRCDIKSIALLPNILAKQEAVERGAFEAIFVTPEGIVREGSSSNIFIIADQTIRCPRQDQHILGGITREVVLQCAQELGHPVHEEVVSLERLLAAEEVFLTGTRVEVLGVVGVDGKTIGEGRVGPLTKRLEASLKRVIRA